MISLGTAFIENDPELLFGKAAAGRAVAGVLENGSPASILHHCHKVRFEREEGAVMFYFFIIFACTFQ